MKIEQIPAFVIRSSCAVAFRSVIRTICLCSVSGLYNRTQVLLHLLLVMRPRWVEQRAEPYETTYARYATRAHAHVTRFFIRRPVFFWFQSDNPMWTWGRQILVKHYHRGQRLGALFRAENKTQSMKYLQRGSSEPNKFKRAPSAGKVLCGTLRTRTTFWIQAGANIKSNRHGA